MIETEDASREALYKLAVKLVAQLVRTQARLDVIVTVLKADASGPASVETESPVPVRVRGGRG